MITSAHSHSVLNQKGHIACGMQNTKIYYHNNNKDGVIRRLLFSKQNAYLLHLMHFWKKPKALILPLFLALSRTIWSHWSWSNCFWSMLLLKINKSGRIWPRMSTQALHPALEVNKLGKKIPRLKGIQLRSLSLIQAPTPPDAGPLWGNAHSTYFCFSRICNKTHSFICNLYIVLFPETMSCPYNCCNERMTNLGQTGNNSFRTAFFLWGKRKDVLL